MNPTLLDPSRAAFVAPFVVIFFAIGIAIFIVPFWMIFKKAGFSPWLSLLTFFPLIGLVVFYVVAFSEWKIAPVRYSYPTAPPTSGYPPAV